MSISTSLRWLLLPLLALPVANGSSAPQAAAPVADATPAPAAAATTPSPAAATAAPVWSGASWPWQRASTLAQLGRRQDTLLSGIRNTTTFEFQVRRDRLVRALATRRMRTSVFCNHSRPIQCGST